ncbi:MAG: ABC transporter permease [Myxococcota bacterium]|nr:ABC transporter permease [Myxococcota bacterium]
MISIEENSLAGRAIRRLKANTQAIVCMGIIGIYLLIAFFGFIGLLPDASMPVTDGQRGPSFDAFGTLLGTDRNGLSVTYKILAGTKTAMVLAVTVVSIAVPIGVTLGAIAGYYGGWIDDFIVWLYTVVVSVPYILMVIAISYVLGKGMIAICIAMGMVSWVGLCRLVRGEFIKHRDREYVLASRLLGAGDRLIIFKHILPNVIHVAIISGSLMSLAAIKSEVILTFLGVGLKGDSWGSLIQGAGDELIEGIYAPLAGVVVAMFLVIYALNVVGDALRDALDPKLVD